jgi:uncharacterized repeat protein (TIGR02543 family)
VLEDVTVSDIVDVICPFVESIDYAPDRRAAGSQRLWAGVIFNGPIAMSGVGDWSTLDINYDLSNIVKNDPIDLPDTGANTPGNNRNLYTMSVTGQAHSNADTLRPDYYTGFTAANYPTGNTAGSGGRTLYYMINMVPAGGGADRTNLYASLRTVSEVSAGGYSSASFAALQTVIGAAVGVYQDEGAAQAAINAQVGTLQAVMDDLVPTRENKDDLLSLIDTALRTKAAQEAWETQPDGNIDNKPCAPYGYARMLVKLAEARAVYTDAGATRAQVGAARSALDEAMRGIRLGYMPEVEDLSPLTALLAQAKTLRANDYALDSWTALLDAVDYGESEVTAITVGSSTITQENIPSAVKMLQDALDGLVDDPAGDKTNLWASTNYAFFNGVNDKYALESEGNYFREGALIDMREWSNLWHYHWRLQPDDNHEYFQIRKWSGTTHTATTVLGPEAKVVEAGTSLILVHGDISDDSQWWKPVRQPGGRFIVVNKADPTLCIAPMSPPANGGRVMLAPLNAADNTWSIFGRANNTTAPGTFMEPLSRAITSVAPLHDVSVAVGTAISGVLPTQVSVNYEGNAKALRGVTWDTSSFDKNTAGTYPITGTIELDGIETNPNEVAASVVIVNLPVTMIGVSAVDGENSDLPVTIPDVGQMIHTTVETDHGIFGVDPANPNLTYSWYYKESPETILSTAPSYTVTRDDMGKTICVNVSSTVYRDGPISWEADGIVPVTLAPAAVDSLSAAASSEQVRLTWSVPASDGGSAIIGYQVQREGDAGWIDIAGLTYTFTGLTNGTRYVFYVRAVNDIGAGTSASVAATPVGSSSPPPSGGTPTTYIVSFNVNGGSAVSNRSVARNSKVTKPTDPTREGYTFDGWYTDAACTMAYDFDKTVTAAFTLYAKWTEVVISDTPDVPSSNVPDNPYYEDVTGHWAENDVIAMTEEKLLNGTGERKFSPNVTLNRATFLTVLWRVFGEEEAETDSLFTDVEAGSWYEKAVAWGAEKGITNGTGAATFSPYLAISREMMVTMLYRCAEVYKLELNAAADTSVFQDAGDVSDWAEDAVKWAIGKTIILGKPGNLIDPKGRATRAEAAVVTARFLPLVKTETEK